MTYKTRIIIAVSALTLMGFPVSMTYSTATAASFDEMEETAEMIMDRDNIITGKMTDFSKSNIVVDSSSQRLCSELKIFSPNNHIIPLGDLKGAEDVKLFVNRGCVRKIVVLRFGR